MQDCNLLDNVPDLQAKELGQFGDNPFPAGSAGGRYRFPFKEAYGETGAARVTARAAVKAGKDPLNCFQTGVNVNVEFLGCEAETICGHKAKTS
jgi:hypothetical protein